MKIGIIGAGNVGGALGRRWDLNGHDILYGVRDINSDKVQMLLKATTVNAGSIAEAINFGEVIVIAIPSSAIASLGQYAGILAGKIVIDTMNRFTPPPSDSVGSVAGDLQALLPEAKVLKAFNHLGAELMLNPTFGAETLTLFLAGDDAEAKATVSSLAEEISFDVVDVGPLSNAADLEALARLWVYLARNSNMGRDFGFKILRR